MRFLLMNFGGNFGVGRVLSTCERPCCVLKEIEFFLVMVRSAGTETYLCVVVVLRKISHRESSSFFWKDQRQHIVGFASVFGKQRIGEVDEEVMERAQDRFI